MTLFAFKTNGTQREDTDESMRNAFYILWYAKGGTHRAKAMSNIKKKF